MRSKIDSFHLPVGNFDSGLILLGVHVCFHAQAHLDPRRSDQAHGQHPLDPVRIWWRRDIWRDGDIDRREFFGLKPERESLN